MGINDGLGYEELGQAGSQVASLFLTGSIVSQSYFSGANIYSTGALHGENVVGDTSISGANIYSNADVQALQNVVLNAGSPYGYGVSIPLTARSNISGGMFVAASGGLAYAAPASTKSPLGIAKPGTDVASGGTVSVITHGIVPVIAEGTIAVGAPAIMGAGAALNTVVAADAGSGTRTFSVLDAAGSEGTVFILL